MSMRHYFNYKTGESGYIDVEDKTPFVPSAYGSVLPADYRFSNFVLHAMIAVITGAIVGACVDSMAIGVITGIVSFVISTIIHVIRKGQMFKWQISYYSSDRSAIPKKIVKYLATIGISIGVNAIIYTNFGLGITVVTAILALIADILIIRKLDEHDIF